MIEWLLEQQQITRIELILLYGITIISAVLGGIGWILLRAWLQPMKLSQFLSGIFVSIPKVFHNWRENEKRRTKPTDNPDYYPQDIKSHMQVSKIRVLRPIIRPNAARCRRTTNEQNNTKKESPKPTRHIQSIGGSNKGVNQNRREPQKFCQGAKIDPDTS